MVRPSVPGQMGKAWKLRGLEVYDVGPWRGHAYRDCVQSFRGRKLLQGKGEGISVAETPYTIRVHETPYTGGGGRSRHDEAWRECESLLNNALCGGGKWWEMERRPIWIRRASAGASAGTAKENQGKYRQGSRRRVLNGILGTLSEGLSDFVGRRRPGGFG